MRERGREIGRKRVKETLTAKRKRACVVENDESLIKVFMTNRVVHVGK